MPTLEEVLATLSHFAPPPDAETLPLYETLFSLVAVTNAGVKIVEQNALRHYLLVINNDAKDGFIWPNQSGGFGNGIAIGGNGAGIQFAKSEYGNPAAHEYYWWSNTNASVAVIACILRAP